VNTAKTALAIVVCIVALGAGVAATAHSRKLLAKEQQVFPAGTLKVGETSAAGGCAITLTSADVTESVASLDTRGSDRRSADPDWRFLRLRIMVENKSSKPVSLGKLLGGLRLIETSTGQPMDTEVVWLRGYDALPKAQVPPGQVREGQLAVYVSSYSLIFPFIVQVNEARFGVDVIDRNAPVQGMR
jgi:hypothetical protein